MNFSLQALVPNVRPDRCRVHIVVVEDLRVEASGADNAMHALDLSLWVFNVSFVRILVHYFRLTSCIVVTTLNHWRGGIIH